MANNKCLVIDEMHESLFSMLNEIGWEADYQPKITREEIKRSILNMEDSLFEVRHQLIAIFLD